MYIFTLGFKNLLSQYFSQKAKERSSKTISNEFSVKCLPQKKLLACFIITFVSLLTGFILMLVDFVVTKILAGVIFFVGFCVVCIVFYTINNPKITVKDKVIDIHKYTDHSFQVTEIEQCYSWKTQPSNTEFLELIFLNKTHIQLSSEDVNFFNFKKYIIRNNISIQKKTDLKTLNNLYDKY